MAVVVRYFAAAAAAAVPQESVRFDGELTVQELLDGCARRFGPDLATVLERSSLLLDAVAVRDRTQVVPDGSTLDVLPPFAGG